MSTVAFGEAKDHLSAILDRVEAGEEITITRDDEAVAKIIPAKRRDIQPIAFVVERLIAARKAGSKLTLDEIISRKNQGRA